MCLTLSHGHRDTQTQRHTDRILKSTHLTLKLRVSFHSESEWRVPLNSFLLSAPPADRQRQRRKSGKKTDRAEGLDRLNVRQHFNQPAAITQWSWQIYIALIKATAGSYFNERRYLSHTTTVEDDPKKHKACLFVNLHVLVQLRIDRVTALGLYRAHCCRLRCRFPAKKASVPRSALLSRSSQGGCHLSYGAQSHIMHTVYTVYEQRNKQTRKKKKKDRSGKQTCGGTNIHTAQNTQTRPRALTSSSLLSSFILVTAT